MASRTWEAIRAEFHEAQGGVCAICRHDLGTDVNLDHCHVTGAIRGVLCTSCNTKLGWYEANRHGVESYLHLAAKHEARRPRAVRRGRVILFDGEPIRVDSELGALG